MIRSMTAFARQSVKAEWGNAHWEIRSVNQRYLDPHFRLPEAFRSLEFSLRDQLRKKLQRGKIDCSLRIEYSPTLAESVTINESLARQFLQAHEQLTALSGVGQAADISEMMKWPGIIQTTELDTKEIEKQLLAGFSDAIESLIAMREQEGSSLIEIIQQRLDGIAEQIVNVRAQMPKVLQWQRERILNRFEEVKSELEPERLEQEMVMVAQKVDVDEEMDRLETHIKEVERLMKKGGVVGRKLDFLMQELNREANTLGSKSICSETTAASVEMKVLIEQMREQIQNIE